MGGDVREAAGIRFGDRQLENGGFDAALISVALDQPVHLPDGRAWLFVRSGPMRDDKGAVIGL